MDDFVEFFTSLLQETECEAQWVYLEITEGTMVKDSSLAKEKLNLLKELGLKIAIDDFGTGYSSLAYLKNLPIDKIKIDRTFVINLPENENDRAIIDSILSLANSLQLSIIVEGVETPKQKNYLQSIGISEIQGYIYSKPVDEEKMQQYLNDGVFNEKK